MKLSPPYLSRVNKTCLGEIEAEKVFYKIVQKYFLKCSVMESFSHFSLWRPLSYRNQSIDLRSKSVDWFLNDIGLRHERVKAFLFWCDNLEMWMSSRKVQIDDLYESIHLVCTQSFLKNYWFLNSDTYTYVKKQSQGGAL